MEYVWKRSCDVAISQINGCGIMQYFYYFHIFIATKEKTFGSITGPLFFQIYVHHPNIAPITPIIFTATPLPA